MSFFQVWPLILANQDSIFVKSRAKVHHFGVKQYKSSTFYLPKYNFEKKRREPSFAEARVVKRAKYRLFYRFNERFWL